MDGGHDSGGCPNQDHREECSDDDSEVDDFFGPQDECSDRTGGEGGDEEVPRGQRVGGGMAGREMRAEGERLRKLGYHEAYDRCKELRLQEGFEVGYEEAFDTSFEIGRKLGLVTTRAALLAADSKTSKVVQEGTDSDRGRVQDGGDSVENPLGSRCPRDATEISAAASRVASIVREFVDFVTTGDGSDGDGGASLAVAAGEDGGVFDRGGDGDGGVGTSPASFAAAAEDVVRRMESVSVDAAGSGAVEGRNSAATSVCADAMSSAKSKAGKSEQG